MADTHAASSAPPQAKPDDAPKPEDIRPVNLPNVSIISGPTPSGATKGGSHNTAGTPGYGFTFNGRAGGNFNIHGAGFNQYGDVFVGGQQVTVTAWDQNRIKGLIPDGVEINDDTEIKVVDGTGTVQLGTARAASTLQGFPVVIVAGPEEVKAFKEQQKQEQQKQQELRQQEKDDAAKQQAESGKQGSGSTSGSQGGGSRAGGSSPAESAAKKQ